MEETLRIADKLIEITSKSKDHVQQSNDFLFVAEVCIFFLFWIIKVLFDFILDLFKNTKFWQS